MSGRRFVVIGAGVVGAALADELVMRGESQVTVLDRGPLYATGGSSSHAPGLISRTSSSKMMQEFADYTLVKFASLELDGAPVAIPVGTLEVACNPERLRELQRRLAFAISWGWRGRMVDPVECAKLWPIIDPSKVVGGYATEGEGLTVALRAVESQARRAIAGGARFIGGCAVTGIEQVDGRVTGVATDQGVVPADVVVCCAGVWGRSLAEKIGLTLPMLAMEHQYAVTSSIPGLSANVSREATLPIVRQADAGLYFRDHGDRVGIGSFNHRIIRVASDDPRNAKGLEFAFTPGDFTKPWELACELIPSLRTSTLERSFNGVFAFTPDGYPLIGEHPELAGFWVAESVWVTHSAGVARAVAETLTEGASSIDASPADLCRFHAVELNPVVFEARCDDSYREVYSVHHPAEGHTSARDLRFSPFAPRQRALGAAFFDGAAWERPRWYNANESLLAGLRIPPRDEWSRRHWSPIIAAEHLAVRERVGLFDMTPLTRIDVSGAGAVPFLLRMLARRVDRPLGSVTYTVMLDPRGGVRSDVTVARVAKDRFVIGGNGPRDVAWLRAHAPRDGSVRIKEVTGTTCCAALWGPRARDVLASLVREPVGNEAFPYMSTREINVGDVPVTATRISYVGELGWELVADRERGLALWDLLWEAGRGHGLVAAGRGALATLRLEKGYRAWGADMTTEHTPDEAGIGFAVRKDDSDFLGRTGLAVRRGLPGVRRLACLVLDGEQPVMGGEPMFLEGRPVGYVTSADFGYSVGHPIAYAWLPSSVKSGDRVEIGYFDQRLPARVAEEPLFDPSGLRLRC